VTRVPTIADIARKTGSTGRPAFVTLTHVLTAPVPDWPDATRQNLAPEIVLFQRCCALTFNSHRTHCHLSCATGIEGFPAPVFHAPLRAIRMMNLANRLIGPATGFTCRGPAALAPGHAVAVKTRKAAGRINLRGRHGDGAVTMQACATFP
jgi:3-methylfumaryl-CoA hydratase